MSSQPVALAGTVVEMTANQAAQLAARTDAINRAVQELNRACADLDELTNEIEAHGIPRLPTVPSLRALPTAGLDEAGTADRNQPIEAGDRVMHRSDVLPDLNNPGTVLSAHAASERAWVLLDGASAPVTYPFDEITRIEKQEAAR